MKDEKNKMKELKRQKQELESALAKAHLKILSMESLLESVEEHYNIDVKKNFGTQQSVKPSPKPKRKN